MLILLSKVTTPVIGWISQLLGWLMNGIYYVLGNLGTEKIGWSIFVYTLIVYMIMLPIQIRTQKQSKMQAFMQPEISKVQKKYQGRRDQESMTRMNEEMQNVYAKYGFSPYGTCLPLAFQMILLIGVYQVIYHIPGYISKIGGMFTGLADKILALPNGASAMAQFISDNKVAVRGIGDVLTQENVIDALYLLKPSQWASLPNVSALSSLSSEINQLSNDLKGVNYFMGLNISMSPWDIIKDSFTTHSWGFLLLGILVPVLAWLTQWVGVKLQPQQPTDSNDQMNSTMKSMNLIMPIFSAFICATLSFGVGIYWITGAVLRAVQMVFINRSMMKVDMDEMIKKNLEKAAKKKAKKKKKNANTVNEKEAVDRSRVNAQAYASRKGIRSNYNNSASAKGDSQTSTYENVDPNSMFAKANMVSRYNDSHKTTTNKSGGKRKKK